MPRFKLAVELEVEATSAAEAACIGFSRLNSDDLKFRVSERVSAVVMTPEVEFTRDEAEAAAGPANGAILATVYLQEWQGDNAITVRETEIDVTDRILALSADEIRAACGFAPDNDHLVEGRLAWGGPFSVTLDTAMFAFLADNGLPAVEELTDEDVAEARKIAGLEIEHPTP